MRRSGCGAAYDLGRKPGPKPDGDATSVHGGGAGAGDGDPDPTGGPTPAQRSRDPLARSRSLVPSLGGGCSRPSELWGRVVAASVGRVAEGLDHGMGS